MLGACTLYRRNIFKMDQYANLRLKDGKIKDHVLKVISGLKVFQGHWMRKKAPVVNDNLLKFSIELGHIVSGLAQVNKAETPHGSKERDGNVDIIVMYIAFYKYPPEKLMKVLRLPTTQLEENVDFKSVRTDTCNAYSFLYEKISWKKFAEQFPDLWNNFTEKSV